METQQVRQRSSASTEPEISRTGPQHPPELVERRREARGYLESISQHCYWFDLWIFLLFDLVLLLVIFLLP